MKARRVWAAVALALFAARPGQVEEASPLQVFAAASLTDVFKDVGAGFEAAHPGRRVAFNFAGTQVLRTQVEQGAEVDVFASADLDHAEALKRSGLVPTFEPFARNGLVVVTPAARPRVTTLADLARPGVRLVLASPTVPAGRYSAEVLSRLQASGAYGEDFAARVEANVASRETNVRLVLSKVALGEADAGIVYETDARAARGKVKAIALPAPAQVIATYTVGVGAAARDPVTARAFVDFLRGPEGQAILTRHGFLP
jgi:molybdate transport system substrate-binding protein